MPYIFVYVYVADPRLCGLAGPAQQAGVRGVQQLVWRMCWSDVTRTVGMCDQNTAIIGLPTSSPPRPHLVPADI